MVTTKNQTPPLTSRSSRAMPSSAALAVPVTALKPGSRREGVIDNATQGCRFKKMVTPESSSTDLREDCSLFGLIFLRRVDAALPAQSQPPYLGKSKTNTPESQPAAGSSTSGWRSALTVSR
jgi:hypothetical protein